MGKLVIFLLIVSVSASFWGGAKAQSNDDCSSVIVSLSPCLGYVTGKETAPALPCCSSLETVVETKPRCLCEVVNGTTASSLGITIDPTRALQLPDACNVKTPPVSRCNVSTGAPSSSPSSAPKQDSAESGSSSKSNSTGARPATKSPAVSDANKLIMQTQLSSSLLIIIIIMFFFLASFTFI